MKNYVCNNDHSLAISVIVRKRSEEWRQKEQSTEQNVKDSTKESKESVVKGMNQALPHWLEMKT